MTPIAENGSSAVSGEKRLSPHGVIESFYRAPEERAGLVNQMFDRSARHYDHICGVLSLGRGGVHRTNSLHQAGLRPGMKLLDVATGTGLVVQAALELGVAAADIAGLDPSAGMLEENHRLHPIKLVRGVGEKLPFPAATFDFISMGYALRHVEDLRLLFSEFRRVLKPQGAVLILEISRPNSRLAFWLLALYLGKAVPALTGLFTRNRDAVRLMQYYWATIAKCVPPETILTSLKAGGFTQVQRKVKGGLLNDYLAVKS